MKILVTELIQNATHKPTTVLELINRARANSLHEVARNQSVSDLNQGLNPGPITTDTKQPLSFNSQLINAARDHSQWMLDNDIFSHTGVNGTSTGDRMTLAGYKFTGAWTWGGKYFLAWYHRYSQY